MRVDDIELKDGEEDVGDLVAEVVLVPLSGK